MSAAARARLEVQHALAHVLYAGFDLPSLAAELIGSFADVAHQLQECVHQCLECKRHLASTDTAHTHRPNLRHAG